MHGHVTLFATKVPEVAHLPPEKQQDVFRHCDSSEDVQMAWQSYWSSPCKIILAPIVLIAGYGILTGRSYFWSSGVAIFVSIIPFYIAKRYYHRKLSAAVRQCARRYIEEQRTEGPHGTR
jgi:hypothetical protein